MANTYTLISTLEATGGVVSGFDFTSIPQTYTDLVILMCGRASADNVNIKITFNGSATAVYYVTYLQNGSQSVGSGDQNAQANILFAGVNAGFTPTASTFGNTRIYIPQYANTSFNKQLTMDSTNPNNGGTYCASDLDSASWLNTSAINQITIIPNTGNFEQYSVASLYGIKNS
jgi:hypothetical protein